MNGPGLGFAYAAYCRTAWGPWTMMTQDGPLTVVATARILAEFPPPFLVPILPTLLRQGRQRNNGEQRQ